MKIESTAFTQAEVDSFLDRQIEHDLLANVNLRDVAGETVTAEFIARHPLVNHREEHVEQLERMLG